MKKTDLYEETDHCGAETGNVNTCLDWISFIHHQKTWYGIREVTSDQLFVILVEIFVVPLNK